MEKQGTDKPATECRVRGHCIVCCDKCDQYCKSNPVTASHTRRGRKIVDFCGVCKVYLCSKCFGTFHDDEIPTLPPCMEKKYGLQSCRRLCLDSAVQPSSPTRSIRRPSSQTSSAGADIGIAMICRAAAEINSPVLTDESPLWQLRQARSKMSKDNGGRTATTRGRTRSEKNGNEVLTTGKHATSNRAVNDDDNGMSGGRTATTRRRTRSEKKWQ